MKITTKVIDVVEMTYEEWKALYDAPWPKKFEGHNILRWNAQDGHDYMILEFEGYEYGKRFCVVITDLE